VNFIKIKTIIFAVIILQLLFAAHAFAQGKVRIVVSVDWEGRGLEAENLEAMQNFRRDFPKIPLQHFLNAAYYTRYPNESELITKLIKSVLRKGDEHGLHIHAWRSLVESSGVEFRKTPSFVEDGYSTADCEIDCGHDIALTGYTTAELRKIIARSVEILTREKFNRPKSFRAGGWQADDKVLGALANEGFTLDSSAVPAGFLRKEWSKYNLYGFVAKLWADISPTSQPFDYKTSSGLKIRELPNNSCLSDYMKGVDMFKVFQANARLLKKNPAKDVYLSIGFHQETAAEYLPRLRQAIKLIRNNAKRKHIPIEFVVAPLN
jgi:peptidoglycan/xylan/chitin deacetylase (PgdA/CDA1 family)